MFPHQPMQERLLRPPPLVLDRVRRRGAQHGFALESHPDANARTTIAGHRDLAGAEESERKSTTGAARALKKRRSVAQAGSEEFDRPGKRAPSRTGEPYSHSIVAGGFPEMS
ncbi:MAG: hypothetical protein Fur0039_27010 [Rhodocyclaceae bacterium]